MLLSSSPVTMEAVGRRLSAAVALLAALVLGVLVLRAASGPERVVVPVIELDRGQGHPTSATTSTPGPDAAPETAGEHVELAPPAVAPIPPLGSPALPPPQTTAGAVIDDDEDDGLGGGDHDGGEEDDKDDRPEADDDDGPGGDDDDDGGEEDDD